MSKETAISLEDKLIVKQSLHQTSTSEKLKNALKQEGFLNIQLSSIENSLLITLENRRYNHNEIDAIGVALGIISNHAGETLFSELGLDTNEQQVELVMLKNGLPVTTINTNMPCYRQFVLSGIDCAKLTFTSGTNGNIYGQKNEQEKKTDAGFGRSQIALSPLIKHRVATEYGVYDYSLALGTNLCTSLWSGSALDVRYVLPLANSDDLKTANFGAMTDIRVR